MEQKEIRLNAGKRKSLINDYRRHCESLSTELKDKYNQAREEATNAIASAFETATAVVQRRFPLEDVATLQQLQIKHNTINAVGDDSCFFFKVTDAPKVLDQYGDEVEKSKHFSFELDGSITGDYGNRYSSGSSNNGKNFPYAMYREEMKAVGLNPDCNIEHDLKKEGNVHRHDNNPYLSTCRNENDSFLNGKTGGSNLYQDWNSNYVLQIIGTGGCRSRAIPCSDLEFQKFEMMIQAKQNVVQSHTKWIESIVAKVNRFEQGIKTMTKFSQVEKFASHSKVNWKIDDEILADKIGMDIVISIDDLADALDNIDKPKLTRDEKLHARMLYEQSKVSSVN
jgi:hypothetical protein